MVELRDGKTAFNEKDMKLAFMYAVPDNIQEEERKRKEQKDDADVERFKALYLNPRVVEDIPQELAGDTQDDAVTKDTDDEAAKRVVGLLAFLHSRCLWRSTRRK